jgi:hypothetical protein
MQHVIRRERDGSSLLAASTQLIDVTVLESTGSSICVRGIGPANQSRGDPNL